MATPRSTQLAFRFQPKLCVDFRGGQMTTDPGLLLLRELDERLRLTRCLDRTVEDTRDARYVDHGVGDLLRQRIYQIVAGYEDAVDANLLRHDPTFQTIIDPDGSEDPLAGQSTISRMENAATWEKSGPRNATSGRGGLSQRALSLQKPQLSRSLGTFRPGC